MSMWGSIQNMRPVEGKIETELHECYGCGNRVENPESRFCSLCGSELRNISRARDL